MEKKKKENVLTNKLGIDLNTKKTLIFFNVILVILLIILFLVCIYEIFIKKVECEECPECEKPQEIIIKEQLINYNGYTFILPDDWNFTSTSNEYKISNNIKTIDIELSVENITYEELTVDETLKNYLQQLTIDKNAKITTNSEKTENETKYYYIEGVKDSYIYSRIILITNDGIMDLDVLYEDQNTYNSLKNEVLKFALSYKKNNI